MFLLDLRYWKCCFVVGHLEKSNWDHRSCKNGVFLSIFWVLRGYAAALPAMPWPACPELAKNHSVQIHEYHAAALFCLQNGHAAALASAFVTECVFGVFWLCFGSGMVL